jgi:DNA-binding protein H-NS
VLPNGVAYLKREIDDDFRAVETDEQPLAEVANNAGNGGAVAHVKAKYRDPLTGETWSGRGRMATWIKRKQDAGEDIEKYRV